MANLRSRDDSWKRGRHTSGESSRLRRAAYRQFPGAKQVQSACAMRREDLLDLNDALQHPGRKIEVDIATELPDDPDIDLVKPMEGSLEAVSTGNLLLLSGQFDARVVLDCARCGAPIEQDVHVEIEEQFPVEGIPSSYSAHDYARVVPDEPYELFEGNSLMVEALLRQALIVSLPLQPLCEYGWDGPCPIALARKAERSSNGGRPGLGGLASLLDPEEPES